VASGQVPPVQPKSTHERVAIVDLGPNAADPVTRDKLAEAARSAGLEPATGDGIDAALAGQTQDLDASELASAVDRATKAFGALDCKAAAPAAADGIHLEAARQASDIAPKNLGRLYAFELLCADRANDVDAAMLAAKRMRIVGAPADMGPLLAKYPEIDSSSDRDVIEVSIAADVPDATVWVDHVKVGKMQGSSPLVVQLATGAHLIAVAAGTRRGWGEGTAVKAQPSVTIPTKDEAVQWTKLSYRIAGWHGEVPPAYELARAMTEARARVLIIRHGDVLEAWGRIGVKEDPHHLAADEGVIGLADTSHMMQLVVERVTAWNAHAPDPDQPLLVESPAERAARGAGSEREASTRWWVYAAVIGAIAAGTLVVYLHDEESDTQRIEVHFP
jgi:hypothetical protein